MKHRDDHVEGELSGSIGRGGKWRYLWNKLKLRTLFDLSLKCEPFYWGRSFIESEDSIYKKRKHFWKVKNGLKRGFMPVRILTGNSWLLEFESGFSLHFPDIDLNWQLEQQDNKTIGNTHFSHNRQIQMNRKKSVCAFQTTKQRKEEAA